MLIVAAWMLVLKGLKEQGRLGRFFGKVTIYDQPQSNTIQKIIALKEAMREMEKYLQKMNVALLKIRSILFAGHPQVLSLSHTRTRMFCFEEHLMRGFVF